MSTGAVAYADPPPLPQQSPIALSSRDAECTRELPELVVDYPDDVEVSRRYVSRDPDDPAGCTTRGREETIEADVPDGAASISLDGVRYDLRSPPVTRTPMRRPAQRGAARRIPVGSRLSRHSVTGRTRLRCLGSVPGQ